MTHRSPAPHEISSGGRQQLGEACLQVVPELGRGGEAHSTGAIPLSEQQRAYVCRRSWTRVGRQSLPALLDRSASGIASRHDPIKIEFAHNINIFHVADGIGRLIQS